MKPFFRRRPLLGWFALTMALFAVLGHVCALPHEAHAVAAEPSDSHDSHEDHSSHDALHTASCEAVQSTVTPAVSVLPPAGLIIVGTFAEPARAAMDARQRPIIATSPPLFLLHASFLI